MTTFAVLIFSHSVFLVGGIWIGFKNAKSSKVEKTKSFLDELTGK